MRAQPGDQARHGHFRRRGDAALHEDARDGRIGLTVAPGEGQAIDPPVGQPHPRRALHLREEKVGLVAEVNEFGRTGRFERAIFDLAAVRIGLQPANAAPRRRQAGIAWS